MKNGVFILYRLVTGISAEWWQYRDGTTVCLIQFIAFLRRTEASLWGSLVQGLYVFQNYCSFHFSLSNIIYFINEKTHWNLCTCNWLIKCKPLLQNEILPPKEFTMRKLQWIHNDELFLLKKSKIGNMLITYRGISPMSVALAGIGLLHCVTNLYASSLISIILLSKASKGASGKAATKIVVKPNCITRKKIHMVRNRKLGKQIFYPP